MKIKINTIIGTILTVLSYLLGGFDLALKTLLIAIVLDYITGVLKAIRNKKLSSEIGLEGIIKKVGYLLIVSLAVLLDKIIGDSGAIRNMVIYFFVVNEGISILENWGGMGLRLPEKLYDILEQLKNKE